MSPETDGFERQLQRDILREVAFRTHAFIVQETPVDTGRLRASIVIEPSLDGDGFIIGTNVEYAAAVENGTLPHVIEPKNKKALAFQSPPRSGNVVITKRVFHPGTKGAFMFMKGMAKIPQFIREAQAKRHIQ